MTEITEPNTRSSLRERLGQPGDAARLKAIDVLDEHCRRILALSPFVVIATSGADGSCDASPRGGTPGFVRMLSPTRLALGELPGNRLFDGAQNLAENPQAALLVMIPGVAETLRIEGRTWLSTESDVLEKTALDGRLPWAAIVMDVTKVFTHCGKAYKRSRLWDPASWPAAEDRPRMGAVMAAHIAAPVPGAGDTAGSGGKAGSTPDVAAVEADLAETYRERLWSPEST